MCDSVLVVAAHPDDEILGCGGTLIKHREAGDKIDWLITTKIKETHGFSEERIESRNSEVLKISKQLNIPTIGIGSSAHCDGQILVIDDLIGLSENKFRFVKKYANLNRIINGAVKRYKSEVLKKQFPQKKHSFVN